MLYIFIASEKDEKFLGPGLEFLEKEGVGSEIITGSVHLQRKKTTKKIKETLQNNNPRVVIAGAATATGLPGGVEAVIRELKLNTIVLGIGFEENPGPPVIQDTAFRLSAQPTGAALAYCGYNEKGFEQACRMAVNNLRH